MSQVQGAYRRQQVLNAFFFLAALLIAIELGLRANERIQTPPPPLLSPDAPRLNIVSFGDSVSASFPSALEDLLNDGSIRTTNGKPHVTVFNLFRTAPNRGLFQKNIENGIQLYQPQIALIMLDTLSFLGPKSPLKDESLPTSNWAKHSLIVRLIYMKLAPLFKALEPTNAISRSPIDASRRSGETETDREAFVNDLMSRTCCTETGALKARELRLQMQQIRWPDAERDRRKIADFLTLLLTHQYPMAEAVLNDLPKTFSQFGAKKHDLEFALAVEKGDYRNAIESIRKSKEPILLSEFLCSTIVNSARANEEVQTEKYFIDECLKQNPQSAKINFYEIDFYVRQNDHSAILKFLPKIERLKASTNVLALSRVYYSAAVHFFYRNDYSTAKQLFENALRRNPQLHRAINYYTTVIRELKKTPTDATIPNDIKNILNTNDRFLRVEHDDGSLSIALKNLKTVEVDARADYPLSYIDAFNKLCRQGIYTIMLNYPHQAIEPMKRGLESVPCLHYIDIKTTIDAEIKSENHRFSEVFQSDGFHLTQLGDELIATTICNHLKQTFGSWFGTTSCAKP